MNVKPSPKEKAYTPHIPMITILDSRGLPEPLQLQAHPQALLEPNLYTLHKFQSTCLASITTDK